MPVNPEAPETRAQTVSKVIARHSEAVLVVVGFVLGAVVAILAAALVG